MKETIKNKKRKEQGGKSIKGKSLPLETRLFDTHRLKPRHQGGEYVDGNYAVALPVEHMEEHRTLKTRSEPFEELKALFDGYKQIQKLRMKVNNQILANERGTDRLDEIDKEYLSKVLADIDEHEEAKGKLIKTWVKKNKDMPIIKDMIAFPSEQGLPYDVIIDTGEKLLKCQVKTTTGPRVIPQRNKESKAYIFTIKRHGKNNTKLYHDKEVDIFALVCLDTMMVGYLKNKEMPGTINIRVDSLKGTYRVEGGIYFSELEREKKWFQEI